MGKRGKVHLPVNEPNLEFPRRWHFHPRTAGNARMSARFRCGSARLVTTSNCLTAETRWPDRGQPSAQPGGLAWLGLLESKPFVGTITPASFFCVVDG